MSRKERRCRLRPFAYASVLDRGIDHLNRLIAVIALGLSLLLVALPATKGQAPRGSPVTTMDRSALVEAIQDEIYDEGCQGYGYDAAAIHSGRTYDLPLYIQPSFDGNGDSWAIYKLLPQGEVYRMFSVDQNGLASLYGHPEWRFPPTGPSYLTVYMDDNQLCQFKHDWIKSSFAVDLMPTSQRIREASQRQRIRLGKEYRPHKRDCSFDWR